MKKARRGGGRAQEHVQETEGERNQEKELSQEKNQHLKKDRLKKS